jgi:ATP/ADP translocase
MRLLRINHFLYGFITGLILPFTGVLIFYLIFFNYMDPQFFLSHIIRSGNWVSVLSLGVIMNLGAFFLFLKNNAELSSRGVLGATFIFAFIAIYYKAF